MTEDTKNPHKPILCLDFDGVIHSYESGWKGADVASDPYVAGAADFLIRAMDHFSVCVFSSRSNQPGGISCMRSYIHHMLEDQLNADSHDIAKLINAISFPTEKPPAMVSIDDRAIQFTGVWPSVAKLKEFKPWNK